MAIAKKKTTKGTKAASLVAKPKKQAGRTVATDKQYAPRADLGAPIDGFFAKQPPHLRAVLEELRSMVERAAPDAKSAIKWGMPFYTIGGANMCALAGHKAHVNLILAGPPGTFADPEGLLSGDGKTGRHLKVSGVGDLPRAAVRGWLKTAAALARKGG